MIALSPRVVTWLRSRLPSGVRARVFALAGPGFVVVEDWPPERRVQATMTQCVILAMLLHLLLVAVIGNAPPGTAAPGQGVWGAINISLRGVRPEPGAADGVPVPDAYSGPQGAAEERRWGGAVRAADAQERAPEPGAARLGPWNPAPTDRAADDDPPVPRSPAPVLQPAGQGLSGDPDAGRPAPEPWPSPTTPAASPAMATPSPSSTVEPEPSPLAQESPATSAFQALPGPPSSARPMPGEVARALEPVRPIDVAAVPDLQPLPPPRPMQALPGAAVRPLERLAPGRNEPLSLPPLAEAPEPPALRPLAPVVEPKTLQPLRAPPPAQEAVMQDIAPVQPIEMPSLPSVPALPAAAPAPRASPVPPQAPSTGPVEPASPSLPTLATPAEVGPGVPRPATGAPDAGARAGRDVATPAAQAASAPRLNLELARPRGGEISQQGSRGVLQVMPRPPELKSKLAEDIEKAARADCRTAHSGAGLLAVGPLVADAVRGKGCKW